MSSAPWGKLSVFYCTLCDRFVHTEPLVGIFGLTCPGEDAEQSEVDQFLAKLAMAKSVDARYGKIDPMVAHDPELVARIWERQIQGNARFAKDEEGNLIHRRSPVTREALVDNIRRSLPAIAGKVRAAELEHELTRGLGTDAELEPGRLTVEKRIEDVRTTKPGIEREWKGRKGNDSDYTLFLGSDDD